MKNNGKITNKLIIIFLSDLESDIMYLAASFPISILSAPI